jgi:hypothetical protein
VVTPQNYRFTISRWTNTVQVGTPSVLEYVMRNRILILLTIISVILIAIFVIPALDSPGGPNLIRNPSFEKPPAKFVDDPNERFDPDCNCKELAAAPARWTTGRFSREARDRTVTRTRTLSRGWSRPICPESGRPRESE